MRRFLTAVLLLAVGVAAGWAAQELLARPEPIARDAEYTLVAARRGEVGQDITLNASASWPTTDTVRAEADGIVTEVLFTDGDLRESGDALVRVDADPVLVAEGTMPMFRQLEPGVSGADVEQLQTLLRAAGFDAPNTGLFDDRTGEAVESWQQELSVPATGVVPLGALVFVPELPARMRLAEGVELGAPVSPGTPILEVLPPEPDFHIVLPDGQVDLVRAGQRVEITTPDTSWSARVDIVGSADDGSGGSQASLSPVHGAESVCHDECAAVPVDGVTLISSTIEITPARTGILVPSSAVTTTADDQTVVVLDDGTPAGVRVLEGSFGSVVVEGVTEGTLVRAPALVPAESETAQP